MNDDVIEDKPKYGRWEAHHCQREVWWRTEAIGRPALQLPGHRAWCYTGFWRRALAFWSRRATV